MLKPQILNVLYVVLLLAGLYYLDNRMSPSGLVYPNQIGLEETTIEDTTSKESSSPILGQPVGPELATPLSGHSSELLAPADDLIKIDIEPIEIPSSTSKKVDVEIQEG